MGQVLAGRTALITGGGSGLGRATTLKFLEEGANVVFTDINAEAARETLEQALHSGLQNIRFFPADIRQEADMEKAVAETAETFGSLDCVFANAGIVEAAGPLTETSIDHFERILSINLLGTFLTLKHGGKVLKEQGKGGSMIATASVAGLIKLDIVPPSYNISKAGVIRLVQEFAAELGQHRIRVNTIAPGSILTPMHGDPELARPTLKQHQPLPMTGEPIDIANMALFLASDQSRFISGATMVVDGGQIAESAKSFHRLDLSNQQSPIDD